MEHHFSLGVCVGERGLCVWGKGCGMKVTVDINVLCLSAGFGSLQKFSLLLGS